MKTRYFIPMIIGTMAISATMASCSDDDDVSASQVPTAVKSTFNEMYPKATNVDWEASQGYYIADFNVNTFDTDAWFLPDGSWQMTETDYGTLTTMLPIMVQDAFADSQYSSWIVDDVELYDRIGDSFVIIEVESGNSPEISLFYSLTGELLNKVQGFDFNITPTTQPESILY